MRGPRGLGPASALCSRSTPLPPLPVPFFPGTWLCQTKLMRSQSDATGKAFQEVSGPKDKPHISQQDICTLSQAFSRCASADTGLSADDFCFPYKD